VRVHPLKTQNKPLAAILCRRGAGGGLRLPNKLLASWLRLRARSVVLVFQCNKLLEKSMLESVEAPSQLAICRRQQR
jgi:hypothetical protein